jgi:hypothetical protein
MMLSNIPKTEKAFYLIYMVWIVILLLQYVSEGVLMIIFFPLFIFYQAFIPLSFIFSIKLFLKGKKWRSRERVGALLFLIPSVVIVVYPLVVHQFQIYTSPPTPELIKSYIQTEQLGGPSDIDVSLPFTRYDKEAKVLEIEIRIDPEKYLEYYRRGSFVLDASASKPFTSHLSYNYLSIPRGISTVTKVPKKIIVKGYWGEELILTGYFTRGLKGYKLIDPYPQVSLIGSQGIWYLEYESNSSRKRVMIERVEGEDFKIDLNVSR